MIRQDRSHATGLWWITAIALLLLLYVAWGETARTVQRFEQARLKTAAESLRSALQAHAQAGLPLSQFAGFSALSAELKNREPVIRAVSCFDSRQVALPDSDAPLPGLQRIVLPVHNKFEMVAQIELGVDADTHRAAVHQWVGMWAAGGGALLLLMAGVLWRWPHRCRSIGSSRTLLLSVLLLQALFVLAGMWQLYAAGARSTAQTVADSIMSRLAGVYEDGLTLNDFSDLPAWLDGFRQGETAVLDIAVRVNDQLLAVSSSTPSSVISLAQTRLMKTRALTSDPPVTLALELGVPTAQVQAAILRNLKNVAALLLSTLLLAMLALRLLHTHLLAQQGPTPRARHAFHQLAAVLFGGVFCDQLTAAFLPVWVARVADAGHWSGAAAAWPFTFYFVCFAGVLLPAQRWTSRYGAGRVLPWGGLALALSTLLLLLFPTFAAAMASRGLAGVGQGIIFVAAQTALLALSAGAGGPDASRTIVAQFNAAMICGLALGSLLVVYVDASGVFVLVTALAGLLAVLSTTLRLPVPVTEASGSRPHRLSARPGWRAWLQGSFVWPALLVGIPSKAVMTGVIVYAIPLLLSGIGLEKEEIGQVLMLYAVGVLASNRLLRRVGNDAGRQRAVCACAMMVSGASVWGLAWVVGESASHPQWLHLTGVLLGSVLLLGLCHGAVNAPVVKLVTLSPLSQQAGTETVATRYRLLERIGHVLGPVTMAACLHAATDATTGLHMVAGALIALGLLFFAVTLHAHRLQRRDGLLPSLIPLGLVVCLGLASIQAWANQAIETTLSSAWLRLDSTLARHWSVSQPGSADAAQPALQSLILAPSRSPDPLSARTVTVLVPRASSAYDTAVSTLLLAWADRQFTPTVRLLYTDNRDDLAHAAMRLARERGDALVMAVGSDITAFLHRHYRQGPLPIVSVCAKDPVMMGLVSDYEKGGGAFIAYTSLNMPIDIQLRYLRQLMPSLRQLGIIVDRNNSSAWQTQALPLQQAASQAGLGVRLIPVDSAHSVLPQLEAQVTLAAAAMRRADPTRQGSALWITGSSSVFPHLSHISRLSHPMLVLSAVPELVRPGPDSALASIGIGFEENAHLAARYALRILRDGARPGDLPVGVVSPPEIAIHMGKARQSGFRPPLAFYENAATVYNADGIQIRWRGSRVPPSIAGDSP